MPASSLDGKTLRSDPTAVKADDSPDAEFGRGPTSVIAFVASRVNSYMTGANINVDGGSDFT